ncbi:MAG: hypothetical protein LBT87_02740 [Treponema sp.]|jgi:hypothetical protein|nr:hypothetical protein [Treponema sp.]
MNDINSFKEGDEVAYRLDEDKIISSSKDFRWIVVEKMTDTLLIRNKDGEREVYPSELLTPEEIKKICGARASDTGGKIKKS